MLFRSIGFLPDLQRILSHLPKSRTTLLFSATFSPEIRRLAESYLHNPIAIEAARPNETAATVEQLFFSVDGDDKRRAVRHILKERDLRQAFIFTNSKLGCARLTRALERDGLRCAALHGDKSQDERLKALEAFKAGEVDLLVCTDVAARGLDIKDVPAVFNYDVPFNAEDYVHRIGRSGRAGRSGVAINLCSLADRSQLSAITRYLERKIDEHRIEGMEPKITSKPKTKPSKKFRGNPSKGYGKKFDDKKSWGGKKGGKPFAHKGGKPLDRKAHV